MRVHVSFQSMLFAVTVLVGGAPAVASAQQEVIVKNEPAAAVPVVPAPGAMAIQRLVYFSVNSSPTVLGPIAAGIQVAITSLTIARDSPGVAFVTLFASTAQPVREGGDSCDAGLPMEYLTVAIVRKDDTTHLSYTQPLMAPSTVPAQSWCLKVSGAFGSGHVTVIGYMK